MTAPVTDAPVVAAPTITARGTSSDAPESERSKRRRTLTLLMILVAVVALGALIDALNRPTSSLPLSIDNPGPDGGRATAEVLRQQGVDVTEVTGTQAALDRAVAGTTLVVFDPHLLREPQRAALAQVEADVVLVVTASSDLSTLAPDLTRTGAAATETRAASCDDPHAQAAGETAMGGSTLTSPGEVCFTTGEDAGLYTSWEVGDATWRAFGDARPFTNDGLILEGNAALVLRALGQHETLTWYLPTTSDAFATEPGPTLLPQPVLVQLVITALALILWQARRLGPVVVEPLPVEVKATETILGRGRLYRRAGAYEHAAAALRAGFLARVAPRVGLPMHAHRDQVIDTLTRASGRPDRAILDLLYGAPPTDERSLIAMTTALDILESEVLRP